MFKKSFVYFFKATCSAVQNNAVAMSDCNILTCGVVNQNKVCLINGSDTTNLSHREIVCDDKINNLTSNDFILLMKILIVNDKHVLGVLKEDSFSIYESNGSGIIYFIESTKLNPDALLCCFTAVRESLIILGNNGGQFSILEICKSGVIQLRETMVGHDSSLICMNSDNVWLASADENATIQFWRATNDDVLDLVSKFSPPPAEVVYPPSTIVILTKSKICAVGFSNGKLCLFNCEYGRILADISAHSRIITGLAFKSDILISVSEDSVCRIWQVGVGSDLEKGDSSSASISLVQSMIIPDQMLQGVAFTDRKYFEFVIASYDSNEMLSFIRS